MIQEPKIRKLTIPKGYYQEDRIMNYVLGGRAYADYSIVSIEDDGDGSYTIWIKNTANELIKWKKVGATVPVSIEYSLNYDEDSDY